MNFFEIINEKYIKDNPIPAFSKSWGVFETMELKNNTKLLKFIFSNSCPKNKYYYYIQQMKKFFFSVFQNYHLNNKCISINNAKSINNLFSILLQNRNNFSNLQQEFIYKCITLQKCGVSVPIELEYNTDFKNNNRNLLFLSDGGISLPDKYFYQKKNYIEILKNLIHIYFNLDDTNLIINIETDISNIMYDHHLKNDSKVTFNLYTLDQLEKLYNKICWDYICKIYFNDDKNDIWIRYPTYINNLLQNIFEKYKMNQWDIYFKWRIIFTFAKYTSPDKYFHYFEKNLIGTKEPLPYIFQSLFICTKYYGFLLCHFFKNKNFNETKNVVLKDIIKKLKKSFQKRIHKNSWMQSETKTRAIKKINKINWKIGGFDLESVDPSEINQYIPNIEIDKNNYIQNIIDLSNWVFINIQNKHKKPINKKEWFMFSFSVNAYYSPEMNEMVFPAGILQKPFFSVEQSIEKNLAGIGMVISHELTHAFDNNGSKFNEYGQMTDWWKKKDYENFEKKRKKIVDIYSKIKIQNEYLNGELICNENIADITALRLTFIVCSKYTNKKKEAKRILLKFFIHFAKCFCNYYSSQFELINIKVDPHAPQNVRVNVPITYFSEFYKIFNLKNPYENICIDVY
jgi:putative endopeptidase